MITYKVSKSNLACGILQKNHRLQYLAYEGRIKEKEKVRIINRGYFITNDWILTDNLYQIIKLSWEKVEKEYPPMNDMWKKSDFKIAIDEIKLYEVSEKTTGSSEFFHSALSQSIPESPIKPPGTADKLTVNASNSSSQSVETPKNDIVFDDDVIDFVPVKELILDEKGKPTEEYKSTK